MKYVRSDVIGRAQLLKGVPLNAKKSRQYGNIW